MTDRMMMSESLRERLSERTLLTLDGKEDANIHAGVKVCIHAEISAIEGDMINLSLWEGRAREISFRAFIKDCQFLLEGITEFDVMVSLDSSEERIWIPVMSHASNVTLSDSTNGMITLTVTKH